ncbi:MAG: HD-GYP domain-containing protein [Pyrinomonadaceae bacterium]
MSDSALYEIDDLSPDAELVQLARTVDNFEGYSKPHAERIASIAETLANEFDLAAQDRYSLKQAALLHDIGEMIMNRDYINVNRPLSEQERLDMQRHPVIGEQEAAKRGLGRAVQLLIRWHHEWWNGDGYPDGLHNETIPLGARILRVADTYAALTDVRPYSIPISEQEACRYLTEWAGIEFDPFVVEKLLALKAVPVTPAVENLDL